MRRLLIPLVSVCLAVTGFAGTADGGVKRHYSHSYYAAKARCDSKEAVGRNIRRYGLSTGKQVKKRHYVRSTATLDSMCRPQPVVTVSSSSAVSPAQAPVAASSGGSCPEVIPGYIIQKESGGDPTAVNSSTGAYGCYQLMPEHYAPGGECDDLGKDVAGQAACAQRLPMSAWDETR